MKRFLFVSAILCLFTSSVFAGWTSFEKGNLFFSNAGGFDQETILEDGQDKEYVRLLDHGTSSTGGSYSSKGIKFMASGTKKSQVYKISPVKLEAGIDSTSPIFLKTPIAGSFPSLNVFISESTAANNTPWMYADGTSKYKLDLELTTFENYCDGGTCDSADLIVGESYSEFIGFDFYNATGSYDFVPSPDVTVSASIITLYKAGIIGSTISLNRSQVLVQTNEEATFFGKNSDNLTTLAVYPKFQYDLGQYDTRIAINSNIPYSPITISGNFKVAGNLSSTGEFGVFTQGIHTFNAGNQQYLSNERQLGCSEFKVNLVANNVIAFGSVSSAIVSGRHPEYNIYFDLYYKRSQVWTKAVYLPSGGGTSGNIARDVSNQNDNNLITPDTGYNNLPNISVKTMTKRDFGGSYSQDSSSLTTQFVGHLPSTEKGLDGANSDEEIYVDYKLCLMINTTKAGSVKFNNDQLQISVLGLPGSTLIGVPPGAGPPIAGLTLAEQGISSGDTDQLLFTENFISFTETGGRNAPALVGYSNYLIFSQGTDYTGLKATTIQADEFYDIYIMKAIHENTPVGYNGSTYSVTLAPMLPMQDQSNSRYLLGFDALKNDNVYAPYAFDVDTGAVSTTERLTSFNIGGYDRGASSATWASNDLKIREGMVFAKDNLLKIFNDDSVAGKSTSQLSFLGETSPGFSLVANANLSYSGSYLGTVGKMFQCQNYADSSTLIKRVVSKEVNDCTITDAKTPITFTIPAAELTSNSDRVGWRFIIFGTVSFVPQTKSWMNMTVTLANSTGASINTDDCNSPCSSGNSYFSADSGANRSYQLNNFIVLDKVKGSQAVTIKMTTSHNLGSGSVAQGRGASISVIALPTTL